MMMIRLAPASIFSLLFSLALLLAAPSAEASREEAIQAWQMLSRDHWAVPVKVKNTNEKSRYPATVYGTVFEFQNLLWFYTSTGTQPLRISENQTEKYKENLLSVLRTIDRGFTSFTRLSVEEPTELEVEFASLKNGCVIESIFSLNELRHTGAPVLEARLLLYSSKNPTRSAGGGAPTGHAVLIYKTPEGVFYVDPPKIDETGQLKRFTDWDPFKMASEIESHYGKIEIEDAFFEPFDLPLTTVATSS